jgi:hypothetical protein
MTLDDKNKVYPGFTFYAETLNGRAAMIGIVSAIVFELAFPETGGLVKVFLGLIGQGASTS